MPLTHVPTLDPALFTVAPHTGAVDTFRMKNADGSFVADINESFIDKLIEHMNERERLTGDLCPLVIGHTEDGQPEVDAPPVVGYARNWHKGTLGETGRPCAFFDAWVFTEEVPRVRRFPRRSCEVWVNRYEVDPISLLGATTPARDLGLMKLSREGSYTKESPGDMTMPDENKGEPKDKASDGKEMDKPKPDPKETGEAKHDKATLEAVIAGQNQILQLLQQMLGGGTGLPNMSPQGAPTDQGADQGAGEMTDADLEKLLSESGGGEGGGDDAGSRAGEKPVQNSAAAAGGMNTHVGEYMAPEHKARLARAETLETENRALRVQLSRKQVQDDLQKLRDQGKDVDPTDEALIADLIAMPDDMRVRQIDRISKLSRPRVGTNTVLLDSAIADARPNDPAGAGRKVMRTREEMQEVMRLARVSGKRYEDVLVEQGYLVHTTR